jgi:hypothetical protein
VSAWLAFLAGMVTGGSCCTFLMACLVAGARADTGIVREAPALPVDKSVENTASL